MKLESGVQPSRCRESADRRSFRHWEEGIRRPQLKKKFLGRRLVGARAMIRLPQ